jgi:hypothetical protein
MMEYIEKINDIGRLKIILHSIKTVESVDELKTLLNN